MPEYNLITYKTKDHVAQITINRPQQRNALNLQVMQELTDAFKRAEDDRGVGVVVITGAGDKAFCAGADVDMFTKLVKDIHMSWQMTGQFNRMVYSARTLGKPVIAKVRGWAIGGAIELLLSCDLIVASETAKFIPGESGMGAVPFAGSTELLTINVGDKRARWLLFTDDAIDAQTAYQWGFVNKVVPDDKLDEEVDNLCRKLLNKSMWALRYAKTQANVWVDLASHALYEGRDVWALQCVLPDLLMAATAFMEKRPMDWVKMRDEEASGVSTEYMWGPYTKICPNCGAQMLPERMKYCGNCGSQL